MDENEIIDELEIEYDEDASPTAAVTTRPPIVSVNAIVRRADLSRALPEVREAFEHERRFCPCCDHAVLIGEPCGFCANRSCSPHFLPRRDDDTPTVGYQNAIGRACAYAVNTIARPKIGVINVRRHKQRTWHLCLWKIALVRQYRRTRQEGPARIDWNRCAIVPIPVDPCPEILPGAIVGHRRIVDVVRIADVPNDPWEITGRAVPFANNPPRWYSHGARPARRVRGWGVTVYYRYDVEDRAEPKVLPDGPFDHDKHLDVAIVGDRIGGPFGPKVAKVQRGIGSRRPVHRLSIVQITGATWTAVTLEDERPDVFDLDELRERTADRLQDLNALVLLRALGPLGVWEASVSAEWLAPTERYGYDRTARRGLEPMDAYVARLAEDLVVCPTCNSPEARHPAHAFPCKPDRSAHASTGISAPQLTLF